MLKITRKTEYALIALKHLQMNRNNLISAKEISNKYSIPKQLLAKILQQMSKLNYISAIQGIYGGYRININLNNISLIKFIEDLEGPIAMVDCSLNIDCLQIENCNIKTPINKINDNIRSVLNNISLNEITK